MVCATVKECDPYNLQLQSALDVDYGKKDSIIDALVLILCMNVRAYSVMKIVLCKMFFCNVLKFLSDTQ